MPREKRPNEIKRPFEQLTEEQFLEYYRIRFLGDIIP